MRSLEKGEAAKQDIARTTGNAKIDVWHFDMSDYASIRAFAQRAAASLDHIDIFLANAGVLRAAYHAINGHEEGIAVNFVGTALLLAAMLPALRRTAATHNTRPTFTVTGSAAYTCTTFSKCSAPPGQLLAALSDEATCGTYWD
jgi:NAD(P)-dependent dehydrogenase (short-subunit alcohol dehydrogenase family)